MPHAAYKCPDPGMWQIAPGGQIIDIVPIEECLDCSLTRDDRTCHFDFSQLQARREDVYNEMFSPSRMNGCDLELYFKTHYDFWSDPKESGHKVRGTAVHSKLETSDPRVISEWRVYRLLPGAVDHEGNPAVISVQPDIVYPSLRQISDNKTWNYLNTNRGQVLPQPIKTENRLQLSVGAWAWANPLKVVTREGVVIDRPSPLQIDTGQIMLSDGKNTLRQNGIELVKDEVLERWMRLRVRQINRARSGEALPALPPIFKRWRCNKGCPVRYLCPITQEETKSDEWNAVRDARRGTSRVTAKSARVANVSGRGVPDPGADAGGDAPSGPPPKGTRRKRDGSTTGKAKSRKS